MRDITRVEIVIDTVNSAFGETNYDKSDEVRRIVTKALDTPFLDNRILMDSNGNSVGRIFIDYER